MCFCSTCEIAIDIQGVQAVCMASMQRPIVMRKQRERLQRPCSTVKPKGTEGERACDFLSDFRFTSGSAFLRPNSPAVLKSWHQRNIFQLNLRTLKNLDFGTIDVKRPTSKVLLPCCTNSPECLPSLAQFSACIISPCSAIRAAACIAPNSVLMTHLSNEL